MCNSNSARTAGSSRGSIWMSDRPLEMYSRLPLLQNVAQDISQEDGSAFPQNSSVLGL